MDTGSPPDVERKSPKRSLAWFAAVGSIIFLYSMSLGCYMCLVSLTGIMNADLGPHPAASWIAPAWTVAYGTGILVAGTLSDVMGRRWFCIGTGVVGMLAGLIGGVAQNVPTSLWQTQPLAVLPLHCGLRGPRVEPGWGINALSAICELVSRKHRGYLAGVANVGATFWVVAGSYLGRRMTVDTAPSWRSIFWLTLAVDGTAAIAIALTYFPETPLAVSRGQAYKSWKEFDWIGLVGVIVAPTLFLVGIINIPRYGEMNGHFIGPFVSGGIGLLALAWYEGFVAPKPLLHPFLFRRVRTFTAILVIACVAGMLFYSLQAWFPVYLEEVYEADAVEVGIYTMPFNAATNAGGLMGSFLLPILGPRIGTRPMLTVGVLFPFIFIPLMCVPGIHQRGMALTFASLAGVGIGMIELTTILLIQLATDDEWIGFATGVLGLVRAIGGSTGTAIYTAIFQTKSQGLVPQYVAEAATGAGLDASLVPKLLAALQGGPADGLTPEILRLSKDAMREASRASFKYIWLSSIAFGALSLVCALGTKDLSPYMTNVIAQRLRGSENDGSSDKKLATTKHVENRSSGEY